MTIEKTKRLIEPLPLYGIESIIYSKEQAFQILKDNSYYINTAGVIGIVLYIMLRINEPGFKSHHNFILFISILHLINGYFIKELQSRIASLFSLLLFIYILFLNMLDGKMSIAIFFCLIFCAASYRAVKASFYYHKN